MPATNSPSRLGLLLIHSRPSLPFRKQLDKQINQRIFNIVFLKIAENCPLDVGMSFKLVAQPARNLRELPVWLGFGFACFVAHGAPRLVEALDRLRAGHSTRSSANDSERSTILNWLPRQSSCIDNDGRRPFNLDARIHQETFAVVYGGWLAPDWPRAGR